MPSFAIVRLAKQHDREAFRCGIEALDRYLHRQAGQDSRRDVAAVYMLEGDDGKEIKGYYTLSAYGVQSDAFPPELQMHCPRYGVTKLLFKPSARSFWPKINSIHA